MYRILICDDERDIVSALKIYLSGEDYVGGVAGLAAGIALCLIQQRFGLITIPAESFLTDEYPVRLCGTDIAAVGISFILTAWCISAATVAAMIPRERK